MAARAVSAKADTASGSPVCAPPIEERSRCRPPAIAPTTAAPTNQMIVARVIEFPTTSLSHRFGALESTLIGSRDRGATACPLGHAPTTTDQRTGRAATPRGETASARAAGVAEKPVTDVV